MAKKQSAKKKNIVWLYLSPQNFRGKITMGITMMGVLATLTLIGTWWYMNSQVIYQYNHIIDNTAPTQYYSKVIEDCISSSTSLTAIYLATSEEEYRTERETVWKDCEVALAALSNYTDQWRNEAVISLVYDVRTKANRLRKEQNNVEQKYFARNADLKEDSKTERVRQVDQLELLTDDVRAVLELIINIQNEEIDRAKAAINFHTQNLWVIVLPGWMIILTLVCVWLAYSINHKLLLRLHVIKHSLRQIAKGNLSNQIKRNENDEVTPIETALNHLANDMERLKIFAKDVGSEKFDTKVIPFNENGEVGKAFINMRDSLKMIAEKDEQLNWAVTGEAHFAKILRDFSEDIDELTQIFVSELVKYLNVSQASLYLLNQDIHSEKELELKAWFAYDSHKNRKNTIQIGEGLIGETYQENRILYLENLPNDYLHIGSALGSAKPISLLFVPLTISDENIGILELAAFRTLENYEIDFVEKVCENITSSIISVQNATRTQKLLEESQMQREAVSAQEEEMRQNVEELQATQEEMERKEKIISQMLIEAEEKERKLTALIKELQAEKDLKKTNDSEEQN
ncbi:GAF domain-containing protein [Bernardetia sp. OM2101]|uniref:GAF domain-containing protein n=1 Tax=Bernardetia sp. OM2101 TaxID=3344876 RepID=UPI0035D108C9